MKNNLLEDKVIIVTGAFGGIGLAIAKACLNSGPQVLLHGRSDRNPSQALGHLNGGGQVAPYVRGVTAADLGADLVATAVRRFGKINGIVNNAAYRVSSRVDHTTLPLFREVLEV